MDKKHYCDKCGKKMKRMAQYEFYCPDCDYTIFDWSLEPKYQKKNPSDFDFADFCRGGELSDDD